MPVVEQAMMDSSTTVVDSISDQTNKEHAYGTLPIAPHACAIFLCSFFLDVHNQHSVRM